MKLNLPTPQPHHVQKLKEIIREQHGIELTDAEALDQCSNMVQYLFLTEHVLPIMSESELAKDLNKASGA